MSSHLGLSWSPATEVERGAVGPAPTLPSPTANAQDLDGGVAARSFLALPTTVAAFDLLEWTLRRRTP